MADVVAQQQERLRPLWSSLEGVMEEQKRGLGRWRKQFNLPLDFGQGPVDAALVSSRSRKVPGLDINLARFRKGKREPMFTSGPFKGVIKISLSRDATNGEVVGLLSFVTPGVGGGITFINEGQLQALIAAFPKKS